MRSVRTGFQVAGDRAHRLWVAALFVALAAVGLLALDARDAAAEAETDEPAIHLCASGQGAVRLVASANDCVKESETAVQVPTAANLDALVSRGEDLQDRVEALEAENAALAGRVGDLQSENVALAGRIGAVESENVAFAGRLEALESLLVGVTRGDHDGYDTLRLSGMNLQVVNGTGSTDGTPNGLGNVIAGYSKQRPEGAPMDRHGSHYLISGDLHTWTSYGGAVFGLQNVASGPWAAVLAGGGNTASGEASAVSGGVANTASAKGSSSSGGLENEASGNFSAISGGNLNQASGALSSVPGGRQNTADGSYSAVVGGYRNDARAQLSAIVGGESNTTVGFNSTILGGILQTLESELGCIPACNAS